MNFPAEERAADWRFTLTVWVRSTSCEADLLFFREKTAICYKGFHEQPGGSSQCNGLTQCALIEPVE